LADVRVEEGRRHRPSPFDEPSTVRGGEAIHSSSVVLSVLKAIDVKSARTKLAWGTRRRAMESCTRDRSTPTYRRLADSSGAAVPGPQPRSRLEHYFGKDGSLLGPSWILL
jgi:hypothetical protein